MQFLIHTGRNANISAEVVTAGLANEVAAIKRLYIDGRLRQIWHREDRAGAIILMEAQSEAEVRDALEALPLVKAGAVVTESIVQLKPYAGFAP